MAKQIIIVLIIGIPSLCKAQYLPQKLTLSQMIMLLNKGRSDANDFLLSNNWRYVNTEGSIMKWMLGRNNSLNSGAIGITYERSGKANRVYYAYLSTQIYNSLKAEVRNNKMTEVNSGTTNYGEFFTSYIGENYAVVFSLGPSKSDYQMHYFFLYRKDTYLKYIYKKDF